MNYNDINSMELFKSIANDLPRVIPYKDNIIIASQPGIRSMKPKAVLNIITPFWDGEKLDICIFCNSEAACCFMDEELIKTGVTKFECLSNHGFRVEIFGNPIVVCENIDNYHMIIMDYSRGEIKSVVTV